MVHCPKSESCVLEWNLTPNRVLMLVLSWTMFSRTVVGTSKWTHILFKQLLLGNQKTLSLPSPFNYWPLKIRILAIGQKIGLGLADSIIDILVPFMLKLLTKTKLWRWAFMETQALNQTTQASAVHDQLRWINKKKRKEIMYLIIAPTVPSYFICSVCLPVNCILFI